MPLLGSKRFTVKEKPSPSDLYGGATFPTSTGIPPSSPTTPDAPDCDPVSLQNKSANRGECRYAKIGCALEPDFPLGQ